MKKIYAFVLILIFTSINSIGQVGINTDQPNINTLLHVSEKQNETDSSNQNKLKGILIPRLTEIERDLLTYEDPLTNPKVLKLFQTDNSLLIYNTTEDCYNYWNYLEREWKSLCGKLGKAEFSFDCAQVQVRGTYIEGKELTTSNFLNIPIIVTKPGEYVITATTENGYSFTTSGTFLNIGNYTVQVQGQGTPLAVQKDNLSISANGIDINCTPPVQVEVLTAAATYTIGCKSIKVNGVYKSGVPLTSTNTITVPVTVTNLGSWEMKTNTVDGISFNGSGTFTTTGTQYVTLNGIGIPTSVDLKTLTLIHNSDGLENSSCQFKVRIVLPKKRVLGIGLATTYGYNISNNRPSRTLLEKNTNFGTLENSVVAYEGWDEFINGSNNPSATQLQSWLLGPNPIDIVVIGYSYNMNQAEADVFLEYLKQGGVLIAHTEGASGNQIMMRTIFNDPTLTQQTTGGTGDGRTYTLPIFDDPIVNGPFGDLRGKVWGDDATDAVYFTNIPTGDIVPYSNAMNANNNTGAVANSITAFRHKTFNFIWIGEGGFTSQSGDATAISSNIICPFILDSNDFPIAKTTYARPVYNSVFFANTMAWAIEQAEFNGINTK